MSAKQQLVRKKLDSEEEIIHPEEEALHIDLQKSQTLTLNLRLLAPPFNLRVLNIQGIDDADFMKLFSSGMRHNQTITNLTISWYFELPGFKYISKIIRHNSNLTRLRIWEFQYTATFSPQIAVAKDKIHCLAKALKRNTTLTSLSLVSDQRNCRRMSNDNIRYLLNALEENNSLFDVRFLQSPFHLNSVPTINMMNSFLTTQRMLNYQITTNHGTMWGLILLTCRFYQANVSSSLKDSILSLLPQISALTENATTEIALCTMPEKAKEQQDEKFRRESEKMKQFTKTKSFQTLTRRNKLDYQTPILLFGFNKKPCDSTIRQVKTENPNPTPCTIL